MRYLWIILTLALLLCAGCARAAAQPTPASPSPTIAAVQGPLAGQPSPARSTPTVASMVGQPTRAAVAAGRPALAEPSIYLWPTYLPADMRPAPAESRVTGEGEVGANGLGFYVVTLNAGPQKLTIGGGDLQDVLPLAGDERPITAGTRTGKLITTGDKREIVFDMPRGKLFIYSAGLSEEELLKVAASLQPIDVQVLRDIAAAK